MNDRTSAVICETALSTFIYQRPDMRYADYGSVSAYRADQRKIAQDKQDALVMLEFCETLGVSMSHYMDACDAAFSGRLSYSPLSQSFEYTPGQYYAIEYRAAACAVLRWAIISHAQSVLGLTGEYPKVIAWLRQSGFFSNSLIKRRFL